MKNLKDSNVYLKFIDSDSADLFVSISDILCAGAPIDEEGDDLEQADDLVYRKTAAGYVAIRA